MFRICFMMPDGKKAYLPDLYDEQTAWTVISQIMAQPEHPRFGWITKVGEAQA